MIKTKKVNKNKKPSEAALMIKSSLKIYGKNIWEVFAVIGIVSIGIFVGLWIAIPGIGRVASNSVDQIINEVKTKITDPFNTQEFINELSRQFKTLDWSNPIKAIQTMFENNNLFNMITTSLKKAGLTDISILQVSAGIKQAINSFTTGFNNQILYLLISVIVAAILSYLGTKLIIQLRSISHPSVWRFIVSFLLNMIVFGLIYYLIILTIMKVKGVAMLFSLLAIFVLMLLLTFIIAALIYKQKDVKTYDVLTFKNLCWLFLVSIIIQTISLLLVVLIYLLSDFVALLMSIPLFLITTIIIENIIIYFVNKANEKVRDYNAKTLDKNANIVVKK